MIRVGMVSEFYDPEGGSAVVPGFIARTLSKRGMKVDVLTGFPNYPHGRTYSNYRQLPYVLEQHDAVRVHRVPLYPSHSTRAISRIAAYSSFAATSTLAMRCLRHCEVILVYSTPVSAGLGPAIGRLFGRRPVVTLVEDLWPETLIHSGIAGESRTWQLAAGFAGTLSDWIYRKSDAIAVIAPSMVDALVARGYPRSKIHVRYNWVPDELTPDPLTTPVVRSETKRSTDFIYAGNLGEPQGVESIIQAAALLRERSDISFTLVGSGVLAPVLRERIHREQLTNVRLLDPRPLDEVRRLVAEADVQLVTLAPRPLFEMTIPSKIQFSLAFGKPMVAAVAGDPAFVARESGAAIVCEPGDVPALAAAVLRAATLSSSELDAMGRRGEQYFHSHFSEDVAGAAMASLLEEVALSSKDRG